MTPRSDRILLLVVVALGWNAWAAGDPFPDAHEDPPTGWTGPVFKLSQDYPATKPAGEAMPWKTNSFKTHPADYLIAVRDYCYEGNIEVDFRGQDNAVRKWFHVPWLHHDSTKGREFIHGTTRERSTPPHRLHPNQSSSFSGYAVGLYNPLGGWTIGRVWEDHEQPNPSKAKFPEGSVACKLLFTAATVAQVPYLAGSPEWQVNGSSTFGGTTRSPMTVRLLQIDVAVKDSRASSTSGWVFGTFNYDANAPGATPWQKMIPVGLMYGNDPSLTPAKYRAGNRPLQSKIITANVKANPATDWKGLGWLERLNGPIDNPASACLSCHQTAQWPDPDPMYMSTLSSNQVNGTDPLDPDDVAQKMKWFRNIKAKSFSAGNVALDYSLQLRDGIEQWNQAGGANR